MQQEKLGKYLVPLIATVFVDLVGLGIVIPTTAPLFIDPRLGFLPSSTSDFARSALLGLLIASYPLAQLFGAPILGSLSDKYGRKKLLLISLVGTLIGYVLFGVGIVTKNLPLLFLSRVLDGFTGGNISVANSAIADISTKENSAKNFGLLGMAFGIGFIIGPFLGGKLADPTVVSWFNSATPYWFATILCVVNILLLIFYFKETYIPNKNIKVNIFGGLQNLIRASRYTDLRVMFLVIFLFTFGFNFFAQFFQVYLIQEYHYTEGQIGNFFAYIGLWIAFSQGAVTRFASKYLKPDQILTITLVSLSIFLYIQLIAQKEWFLYVVGPFIAFTFGLTIPNSNAIVSALAPKDKQGEVMGVSQSVICLGQGITPMLAGVLLTFHHNFPVIISSSCMFLAWVVFIKLYKPPQSS